MSVAQSGLTATPAGFGLKRLVPIGAAETGEPSDIPWFDAAELRRRAAVLAKQPLAVELPRVPADSPTLDALKSAFSGRGFTRVRPAAGTPYIELDDSWAEPESKFNAGRRSDFRRARRHAETMGGLSFEMLDKLDPAQLDRYIDEAYAVEASSWKGAGGTALSSDETLGPFFRRYAHAAMEAGIMRLAFMRVVGVAVGMQFAVELEGALWLLKIGYDPAFAKCSPGNLLMLFTLGESAKRGLRSYEFLGSAAPWTAHWTSRLRPYLSARFYPASIRGLLTLLMDLFISAKARVAERRALGSRPVRRWLRAAGTRVLGFASRAYVPGPHLSDAMKWAHRMERRGVGCTLGYFNADDEAVDAVMAQDLAAMAALDGVEGGYLSVKVPSLGYDTAALRRLADEAHARGQRLHFDSHGPETGTPTIAALGRLVGAGRKLGLTVPARWKRSLEDVDWALANDVRVRVVKGQWACPDQPDADLRESFLAVIDRLAGRASEVAVATHDAPLAREALRRLQAAGTPCELELLCGLPRRDAMAVARELKVPVRLYIPFGQAWLPYALDQAVRSPKMLWWMVRDTFSALR